MFHRSIRSIICFRYHCLLRLGIDERFEDSHGINRQSRFPTSSITLHSFNESRYARCIYTRHLCRSTYRHRTCQLPGRVCRRWRNELYPFHPVKSQTKHGHLFQPLQHTFQSKVPFLFKTLQKRRSSFAPRNGLRRVQFTVRLSTSQLRSPQLQQSTQACRQERPRKRRVSGHPFKLPSLYR